MSFHAGVVFTLAVNTGAACLSLFRVNVCWLPLLQLGVPPFISLCCLPFMPAHVLHL